MLKINWDSNNILNGFVKFKGFVVAAPTASAPAAVSVSAVVSAAVSAASADTRSLPYSPTKLSYIQCKTTKNFESKLTFSGDKTAAACLVF